MTGPWTLTPHGVVLRVHLQPRASRNRLVGLHGQALKITLTAPPVEGAANDALLTFLATLLHVPRSAVSLLSGTKSREKQVLVHTADPEQVTRVVKLHLSRLDKRRGDD